MKIQKFNEIDDFDDFDDENVKDIFEPSGVVYNFTYEDENYSVFFPHDFINEKSDIEYLKADGIIILDEEFKTVPYGPKYYELEEFIENTLE
jgi:hypothetical protein